MNNNDQYPCLVCKREVKHDALQCSICLIWLHRNCAKLSKAELKRLSNDEYHWYCVECSNNFPFNSLLSDKFEFIVSNFESTTLYDITNRCKQFESCTERTNQSIYNIFEEKILYR